MKIGFVYAGQGSQHVGMGLSFYENYEECKNLLDSLSLDFDFKSLMFHGDENLLNQTQYTQPCMVAVALMANVLLRKHNITPDYVCGLSLGEYSALSYANVFNDQDVLNIVRKRGLAMEEAAKDVQSKMYAVLGLDRETLNEIINETEGYVAISNYNCPSQLVIAGEIDACDKVALKAKEKGARRVVPLNTSGPFHTELLKDASETLHEYFKTVNFNEMQTPVIFNTTATESNNETIPSLLEKQVKSPVYFEDSIRYMIDKGVDTIIEIGPGKVLSGFVKKIDRSIKTYAIEDKESFEKLLNALGE